MKKTKENPPVSSKEEKAKTKLPGYPYYKQEEDIMSPQSDEGRIEMNLDDVSKKISPLDIPKSANASQAGVKGERRGRREVKQAKKSEVNHVTDDPDTDVTKEERDMLESEGMLMDKMYAPSDLDIPGSDLDDESEDIGSEDEENNYYSLGGDDKENLEEDPT